MTEASSKTPQQQRKVIGKPFVKGDVRINRKGRPPVNSDELNALLDAIFAEEISDGKTTMSKLRVALNRLLLSKNPTGAIHVLDRRYGKVKEIHELTGKDGKDLITPTDNKQVLDRVNQLLELAKQRKEKDAG